MAKLDNDRYRVERFVADGGTVEVQIQETSDDDPNVSGALALVYHGPEVRGKRSEQAAGRHYHDTWYDTDAVDQVNLDGETEVEFSVPQEYVNGEGRWVLHHDEDPVPLYRVSAADARPGDESGEVDTRLEARYEEQIARLEARIERLEQEG